MIKYKTIILSRYMCIHYLLQRMPIVSGAVFVPSLQTSLIRMLLRIYAVTLPYIMFFLMQNNLLRVYFMGVLQKLSHTIAKND